MIRHLLAALLLIPLVFATGCKPKGETPPPSEPIADVKPEKSKKDVTICIARMAPDILKQKVKADGKQRVAWKSHDAPYEVWFDTATWPFEEEPSETREGYNIIKVPYTAGATSSETSDSFTLKALAPGETKEYSYRVGTDPATVIPPPNSPAVIGEG